MVIRVGKVSVVRYCGEEVTVCLHHLSSGLNFQQENQTRYHQKSTPMNMEVFFFPKYYRVNYGTVEHRKLN